MNSHGSSGRFSSINVMTSWPWHVPVHMGKNAGSNGMEQSRMGLSCLSLEVPPYSNGNEPGQTPCLLACERHYVAFCVPSWCVMMCLSSRLTSTAMFSGPQRLAPAQRPKTRGWPGSVDPGDVYQALRAVAHPRHDPHNCRARSRRAGDPSKTPR